MLTVRGCGWYRLFPTCAHDADEWLEDERACNLARCQVEMQAVTDFFKEHWQKMQTAEIQQCVEQVMQEEDA